MKLDFYNVDKEYVSYMQAAECQKRGFTRIPNMDYEGRKQKFLCGIILTAPMTHLKYFVGVTHYKIQRSENFLIQIENDREPVKGSLRFNFMFPVPLQSVTRINIDEEPDSNYRILLSKELKAINNNAEDITAKANSVYEKITSKKCSQNLLFNSCDFTYLEEKCIEYCKTRNLTLPSNDAESHKKEKFEPEKTPFNDLLVEITHSQQIKENNVSKKNRHIDPER